MNKKEKQLTALIKEKEQKLKELCENYDKKREQMLEENWIMRAIPTSAELMDKTRDNMSFGDVEDAYSLKDTLEDSLPTFKVVMCRNTYSDDIKLSLGLYIYGQLQYSIYDFIPQHIFDGTIKFIVEIITPTLQKMSEKLIKKYYKSLTKRRKNDKRKSKSNVAK